MIKTRKELLEDLYNEVHSHYIQTELAHDSLQSKVITLIKPGEEEMRGQLDMKLAQLKNTMDGDEKAMKRIQSKIDELDKIKLK